MTLAVLDSLLVLGDVALFLLRLAVGVIFIYHALPKLKDSKGMASAVGMPAQAIVMLGLVELLSGAGLIFGVFTQIAAFLLAVVMVGAILMKAMKWKVPFAAQDKTGWEFDIILLAANLVILTTGGGSMIIF